MFRTDLGERALTKRIEKELEGYMGRPIATTLRTLEQTIAAVSSQTVARSRAASEGRFDRPLGRR